MSDNSAPVAPDYSSITTAQANSADQSLANSKDQLAWAKNAYADNKANTDAVVDSFLKTQTTANDNAAADRARYQDVFQPQEDSLVADANSYNSPARRDLDMGRAGATVSQNFDAARANATRDLEGYGISPDATRFAALDTNARVQQGAAVAGAQNQAGLADDATARALRSEAITVGRGYPGQVAGEINTGLQAGTGAVNSNLATTANGSATMGTPVAWNAAGTGALAQWGNTLNTGFQNASTQFTNNQNSSSGIGSALGFGASLLMAADGGEIPTGATPGGAVPAEVSPSRGVAVDDVDAKLTAGEFIIPKKAVEWYGTKHFYGLIEKADKDKAEAQARTGAIPRTAGQGPAPARRPQALQVA